MIPKMFVLYRKPPDFPGAWVVRAWELDGGSFAPVDPPVAVAPTRELAIAGGVPDKAVPMMPSDGADPTVVAAWLGNE